MLTTEHRILSELCYNNARAAQQLERYPVAEHWYKNSLELDPTNTELHYDASFAFALQRKYPEAISHLDIAATNEALRVNAVYTRALLKLNTEDYVGGFKDYETRLELPNIEHGLYKEAPYWGGQDCGSLHIYGEQGYGDIFMFCRFIPTIKNVGCIYFEVPQACYDLIKYNFRGYSNITVISNRDNLKVDYTVHLCSLAHLSGCTIDTLPTPFKIEAEPEYIEKWKHVKGHIATCSGGRLDEGSLTIREWNARRNVDPEGLKGFLDNTKLPQVSLENYQNPQIKTWSDTAGIIANCEYVVTIDSGPCHLAASMGVKTYLLQHYQCCWRYTLTRRHTPWYGDNLIILRQPVEKDWHSVFSQLQKELQNV